jgi:GNAT superfamily N-acetyltransferase
LDCLNFDFILTVSATEKTMKDLRKLDKGEVTHPGTVLSRVRRIVRKDGLMGLVARALRVSVDSIVSIRRVAFLDVDLTQAAVRLPPPSVGVQFVVAEASDLTGRFRASLQLDFDLGPQEVGHRLAHSHIAVVAVHQGRLAAIVWLAFNEQEASEIGQTIRLQPAEVLTYNEVTHPSWRGRGIMLHLNLFADEYAKQRATRRRITWRRCNNAPAMRVSEKLGHRLFAVVTTVHVMRSARPFVFGLKSAEMAVLVRQP